jgi:thiamine biosynthesis lipoprotein
MEYAEFRAMNSDILLAAEGEIDRVATGFSHARQFIEKSEKRFTRFSDHSELALLNRSAGDCFKASAALFEVVNLSQGLMLQTGGLFDPSILPALRQAGYDQSMDELRKKSPLGSREPGKPVKQDFRMLRLDPTTKGIWMPPGMQIDLGGIAKGWIAEQAARLLAKYSPACAVNAGGDMFLIGLPEGEYAWHVGLEDPLDPLQDLTQLKVGPGAIATSSIVKRSWVQDGRLQHHLIDPRTGRPAETEWLSVTVIAPHTAQAEVFAKTILIAGSDGDRFVSQNDEEMAFIAVDKDRNIFVSEKGKEVIDVELQYA